MVKNYLLSMGGTVHPALGFLTENKSQTFPELLENNSDKSPEYDFFDPLNAQK